jgi:hypothetical protein
MNPEFLRNLWLEATPFRLALIAGLLLLVFSAASVSPTGLMTTSGAAQALYWFFVVLWGTRSAALSVVGEIRERTWDGQKLSSIGPAEMLWGKLFGATFANWFGGALCLPFILAPMWIAHGPRACLTYAAILVTLGVFAQAMALLSSLNLIRRHTGNWRLDTFLCQVVGIGAAFAYFTLWSSISAFYRTDSQTLQWWDHDFNLANFHLVSLLMCAFWALVGCYRAMRAELRFANGPFVWLAYLAYLCVYEAGFESWITAQTPHLSLMGADPGLHSAAMRVALAGFAVLCATYGMVFLEPKDPVRMRWLGEQIRAGRIGNAFLALDAWMLSYGVTAILTLVLAALLARDGAMLDDHSAADYAPTVLAMLGFLTRDVAIFVLMRGIAKSRGDFAALAVLGALYILLPLIASGLGLKSIDFVFFPVAGSLVGAAVAWGQGIAVTMWAVSQIRPSGFRKTKPSIT